MIKCSQAPFTPDKILDPDGIFIRAVRYALALVFVVFALAKFSSPQVTAFWMGDMKLTGATMAAVSLLELVIAAMLMWRVTFALSAWFILILGSAIAAISMMTTGSIPVSGILISASAVILSLSDRKYGA